MVEPTLGLSVVTFEEVVTIVLASTSAQMLPSIHIYVTSLLTSGFLTLCVCAVYKLI